MSLLAQLKFSSSALTFDTAEEVDAAFDELSSGAGDEAKAALVIAWEAACRICSKRLAPFLPALVAVLEKHG